MKKKSFPAPAEAINPGYMIVGELSRLRPIRSQTVTGLLCIFLGAFGFDRFYVKKIGRGILRLLLTLLLLGAYSAVKLTLGMDMTPWYIAFGVYSLIYVLYGFFILLMSEKKFRERNQVRTF